MTKLYTYSVVLIALFMLSAPAFSAAPLPVCSVKILKDVQYGTGTVLKPGSKTETLQVPLTLDAYLPVDCTGLVGVPKPVGVVHGGAFRIGTSKDPAIVRISTDLAKSGFAAFSINYRLAADTTAPKAILETPLDKKKLDEQRRKYADELRRIDDLLSQKGRASYETIAYSNMIAIEDAAKAKKFVSNNKARFNIAPDEWGMIGSSAGALTIIGMAFAADDIGFGEHRPTSVVDLWGGLVLPGDVEKTDTSNLMIVHGTKDTVVPYVLSTSLLNQAKAAGINAFRVSIEGARHGFGASGINLWKRTLPGSNITIMQGIIQFLDTTLRPAKG